MTAAVAIVGASLAGLSAARALRAQSYDGRIVVIGDERHAPYDRPPLSKEFLADTCSQEDVALGTAADEALDLDWRLGSTAVGLHRGTRSVRLADGSEVRADGVVLATGARARRLPGTESLAGVHVLRSLDDAVTLSADLLAAEHLVVIEAGFIGAEVASTARALGVQVTVVEAQPVPLAGPLGAEMGAVCAELHADHGTRLLSGTGVARLVGSNRVQAVELADGRRLPADVVVVGIGAAPNVEWLADSCVALDHGVLTDERCATNVPGGRGRRGLRGDLVARVGTRRARGALDPRPITAHDRGRHPARHRTAAGDDRPVLLVGAVRPPHTVRGDPSRR